MRILQLTAEDADLYSMRLLLEGLAVPNQTQRRVGGLARLEDEMKRRLMCQPNHSRKWPRAS